MKKTIINFISILMIVILIASCQSQEPVQVDMEPPLTNEELSKQVPNFLNEDQQYLFIKMRSVYQRLFSGSSGIAYGDIYGFGNEYDHFKIDNQTYISNTTGRYRNYEDFERMIKSLFVDEFWDARNTENYKNEEYPLYTNCDDKLCYIDFDGSGGFAYNNNFEDEYELISKTENEISFYTIGHYSWRYQFKDETIEQRDQRLKDEYEYTKKFLITLISTEDGWRFSEFSDPITDGGNYEGIHFRD
ncbi:MAG: hypothetical protein ACYDEI_05795 [Erysipelotrichaceae bacterium]